MVNIDEMGILLGERRRKLGYTQEMVAEIIGITDKTIRNIEYGLTVAELETVLNLWDLYRLPNNILFELHQRSNEMEEAMQFHHNRMKNTKKRFRQANDE